MITLAWQRLFDQERPQRPPMPATTKCAACPNPTLGPDVWWCSPICLQTWTGRHNHVSGQL